MNDKEEKISEAETNKFYEEYAKHLPGLNFKEKPTLNDVKQLFTENGWGFKRMDDGKLVPNPTPDPTQYNQIREALMKVITTNDVFKETKDAPKNN